MTTPRIPTGFKPLIAPYGADSAGGVDRTPVDGGAPRYALAFDRGVQRFQVSMLLSAAAFSVWTTFYHRRIGKGSITFEMPIDSGFGMDFHRGNIVPESYAESRNGPYTIVAFTFEAEPQIYDLTDADSDAVLALWEVYGEATDELLDRLAKFATVDTLVLDF